MAKQAGTCPECGSRVEFGPADDGAVICAECSAALSPSDLADPLVGQTLGEFEIVEPIGRGGMGAVYRAAQPSLGRFVAVKVVPERFSRNENFLARFQREARAAAAVEHPNILEIFTIGEDRGYHYIAMELVHGEDLSQIVKRDGALPPERAVEIVRQVAAALAKAHAAGVLHRDIKPSNILVTPDGLVKVADFGLAKRPDVDANVTQTGKGVGTPQYLAPECARGQAFDRRSDLYALGATFYYLLAGRAPFEGSTTAEVVAKLLETDPPRLRELAPGVSRALAHVIRRLLSKDPAARCQTAEEVLEALQEAEGAPSGTLGDLIDALHAEAPPAAAAASRPAPRAPSRAAPTPTPPATPTPRTPPFGSEPQGRRLTPDEIPVAKKAEFPKALIATIAAGILALAVVLVIVLVPWGEGTPEKPPPAEPGSVAVKPKLPVTPKPKPPITPKPKPKPKPKPPKPVSQWTMLPNGWRVGKAVNLGPVVNSSASDGGPSVSADGRTMVFTSHRGGGQGRADLWMSSRPSAHAAWGEPANLGAPVNSKDNECNPSLSADGLMLVFQSDCAGGQGGHDLWVCTRRGTARPWSPPVNLGRPVNSPTHESYPCLSTDGLTLIFVRSDERGQDKDDLWMSSRPSAGAPWGEPANLGAPVNTKDGEAGPSLSADGLTLVFQSDRPGGQGGPDLWMSTRAATTKPFGQPVNLGASVNSGASDVTGCLSAEGRTLYFYSYRPGGHGGSDLWQAPLLPPGAAEEWTTLPNGWRVGRPVNLGPVVNSSAHDGGPSVSADGGTMVFSSWRGGGQGGADLWMSSRPGADAPWGQPVSLGAPVNTKDREYSPSLSPDGLTLVFQSDRAGGRGGFDLWMSTRRGTAQAWGPPVNLGPPVNSPAFEAHPCLSTDGLTLVFMRTDKWGSGKHDLWMSSRPSAGAPWGQPASLGAPVNTKKFREGAPSLSADGLTLVFQSDRRGGQGSYDLWMSTRAGTTKPFGEPVNLGASVNSGADDAGGCLIAEDPTLYFSSERPGGHGRSDIWQAPLLPPGAPLPTAPPDDDERWTEWQDLFDGKTLKGWKAVAEFPGLLGDVSKGGDVRVDQGQLILDRRGNAKYWCTGAAWTGDFPASDYEVIAEVMRVTGGGDVCNFAFPVGDAGCRLVVGGKNGTYVGLDELDGEPYDSNATTRRMALRTGRWYAIRLRVTRARVQAWIDNEAILDLPTAGHTFSKAGYVAPLKPFGVNVANTVGAIRSIRLRRLKSAADGPEERPIYAGRWIKHAKGVLSPGPSGAWDSLSVMSPCVIKVADSYRMYYLGMANKKGPFQTGLATSKDLIHWTKHPQNPILRAEEGKWDSHFAAKANVIRDGALFRMYYGGRPEGRSGYAESTDGIRWTKPPLRLFEYKGSKENNICFVPGKSGAWDSAIAAAPQVLKVAGTYHAYYYAAIYGRGYFAGHATSRDGIHWTRDSVNPVMQPGRKGEWDDSGPKGVHVTHSRGSFHMFYHGRRALRDSRFGLAVSSDGSRWRKWRGNPILSPGPPGAWDSVEIGHPWLFEDDAGSFLFYMGRKGDYGHQIGLAKLRPARGGVQPREQPPWKVYTKWPFGAAEAKRRQAETAKALGVNVEETIDLGGGVKLTLVLIPAGEFLMGSPAKPSIQELVKLYGGQVDWYRTERPQHRVRITRPFLLAKYEVTQEQWQAVMGTNPSQFGRKPQNPVEMLSWNDCQSFLTKLNEKSPRTKLRFPTDAEWEYACRAGTATQFCFGDGKEKLGDYTWCGENSGGRTHPVGQKRPNAWGLYGMHGNVSEWCGDWYEVYVPATQVDPTGPPAGTHRVLRGGAWGSRVFTTERSAGRGRQPPEAKLASWGLRVAMPVQVRVAAKPKPPPTATAPATRPAAGKPGKGEIRYAKALAPAEAEVAAWDFRGAAAELAKVNFTEKALAERVARRREEVERLARLKAKMIERLSKTKPWLKKSTVVVGGKVRTMGRQIVAADEKGITIHETTGRTEKTEAQTWQDLDARTVQRLLDLTVDRKSADDYLAAGILSLGLKDTTAAEKHFEKARSLGAKIDRYLDPLAAAAFARAKELLDTRKFTEAGAALTSFEKKYAKTPWLASHKKEFDAARKQAQAAIAEAEGEKLYAEAAKLFKKERLFDLKPILDKLESDYAKTRGVTDTSRKPSFAEMAKAVADLGKFLIVRKDGKGNFKTIQAAIDAAPPNSLIEIQDDGPYREALSAAKEKEGLTLRGGNDCWPIITSGPSTRKFTHLLKFDGPRILLERLVIVHASDIPSACAVELGPQSRLRWIIIAQKGRIGTACSGNDLVVENSFLAGHSLVRWRCNVRNSIFAGAGGLDADSCENVVVKMRHPCSLGERFQGRFCTFLNGARLTEGGGVFLDCIFPQVDSAKPDTKIDNCNVFGSPPFLNSAKPGKGCFGGDPQFRDPKNFDYRLKPTSPCRGKASDGGDVGVRYTPEMIEILKKALELRKKGILKF